MTVSTMADRFIAFSGQSNMNGYGEVTDLTIDDLDLSGVYGWNWRYNRWDHNPSPLTNKDVFHADHYLNLDVHDMLDNFGPEITMLKKVRKVTNEKVYFIKMAVGGSYLDQWDNTYYPILKSEIVQTGKTPDSFVWFQGESDALTENTANSYEGRLSNYVARIRSDFGTVQFIATRIAKRWTFHKKVNKAIYELNRDQVISMVPTADLSTHVGPDSHPEGMNTAHYDSRSNRVLGLKYAASYLYCSNTNSYPALVSDFDGDKHEDILWMKPVRGEKHFSIRGMVDFKIVSQNFLTVDFWEDPNNYEKMPEYFDFVSATDPDNDGDYDIGHVNTEDLLDSSGNVSVKAYEGMWIWRLEDFNIIASQWYRE